MLRRLAFDFWIGVEVVNEGLLVGKETVGGNGCQRRLEHVDLTGNCAVTGLQLCWLMIFVSACMFRVRSESKDGLLHIHAFVGGACKGSMRALMRIAENRD